MFREEKNLKDSIKDTSSMPAPYQAVGFGSGSYTKTNKLITALYMVTDIIDENEPLRNKLRTLGIEILSDISMPKTIFDISKIDQILSFLDIASTVNIISEMNCSILKKEFLELNQSLKESTNTLKAINKQINLSEFFKNSPLEEYPLGGGGSNLSTPTFGHPSRGELKGHTRIGVQKGSTLMRALSDRLTPEARSTGQQDFDLLKKQRRIDIINIIKIIGGNATIKDIKDRAKVPQSKTMSLMSCSEKTLQRELVSMVKDNVLYKVGEKRWSRYQLRIGN